MEAGALTYGDDRFRFQELVVCRDAPQGVKKAEVMADKAGLMDSKKKFIVYKKKIMDLKG